MQVFNALQTITKIWVAFNLRRQGNILKGSDDKIKKDENIKDTRKITKWVKRWEVKGWVSHIGNWTGWAQRTCPGPTSAGGVVDAGFSDSDVSCSRPSWTRLPHQAPCNPWERPLCGPQETASAACALASVWAGIWKAIEWHPPCCSPLCPAMGSLACASAPQAQVCYMFPSGISKGAWRIVPRILDTGIS